MDILTIRSVAEAYPIRFIIPSGSFVGILRCPYNFGFQSLLTFKRKNMLTPLYTGLWHKYRPAILKMMIDAENEPQTYQLSDHEFQAMNNGKKGKYTFSLEVGEGKVQKGLKDSVVAQDLWEVLQLSPKASELIASSAFEFSLDKQFVLHVHKHTLS